MQSPLQDWQGRFPDAPVGLVIDYMGSLGHGGFQGAAEGKEQASHFPLQESSKRNFPVLPLLPKGGKGQNGKSLLTGQ